MLYLSLEAPVRNVKNANYTAHNLTPQKAITPYFNVNMKKRKLDGVVSAYFAESKLSFYVAFAVGALPADFFLVDV